MTFDPGRRGPRPVELDGHTPACPTWASEEQVASLMAEEYGLRYHVRPDQVISAAAPGPRPSRCGSPTTIDPDWPTIAKLLDESHRALRPTSSARAHRAPPSPSARVGGLAPARASRAPQPPPARRRREHRAGRRRRRNARRDFGRHGLGARRTGLTSTRSTRCTDRRPAPSTPPTSWRARPALGTQHLLRRHQQRAFIDLARAPGGRPIVNLGYLLDDVRDRRKRLDSARARRRRRRWPCWPPNVDTRARRSVLGPFADARALMGALRAGATMPVVAGAPFPLRRPALSGRVAERADSGADGRGARATRTCWRCSPAAAPCGPAVRIRSLLRGPATAPPVRRPLAARYLDRAEPYRR